MRIKEYIDHLDDARKAKLGEVVRFGIVGVIATILQYLVYLLFLLWLNHSIALAIGYVVSFLFNFYASTHYTFRVKANAKHGAGFAFSHVVNFLLQQLLLEAFILLGVSKQLAPIPMFCICVPVNFLLVRFFLKR
jgi:putative flippase GtrA